MFLAPVFLVQDVRAQASPERTLITPPSAETQTLGPGDQIQVRALHAEELGDRATRIDSEGFIMLPGLGRIRAGGLTTEQLAASIRQLLTKTIREPEVAIDIVELKSQPVSVLGAVKIPGVYQIVGQKRLLEVISMAGGLDTEAGDSIRVTRKLANSQNEKFDVIQVRVAELMDGVRPEMNIVLHAEDTITVSRAKLIYVLGNVHRAGGFILRERQSMSILQALSMAEGAMPNSSMGNVRILRQTEPRAQRKEILVNVKNILAGKDADQALLPDDVLYIPSSTGKMVLTRAIEAALQTGTGIVIWGKY